MKKDTQTNPNLQPYKHHLGLSLSEMGSLLGLSREAVRQKFMRLTKYKNYQGVINEQRQEIERLKRHITDLQLLIQHHQPLQAQQLSLFPEQQGFEYIKNCSVRTMKLMERLGFRSLEDIQQYGFQRLASEPNIGSKSLQIIEQGLRMGGLAPRET
jgi:hypothetical protein